MPPLRRLIPVHQDVEAATVDSDLALHGAEAEHNVVDSAVLVQLGAGGILPEDLHCGVKFRTSPPSRCRKLLRSAN